MDLVTDKSFQTIRIKGLPKNLLLYKWLILKFFASGFAPGQNCAL